MEYPEFDFSQDKTIEEALGNGDFGLNVAIIESFGHLDDIIVGDPLRTPCELCGRGEITHWARAVVRDTLAGDLVETTVALCGHCLTEGINRWVLGYRPKP